MGKTDLYGAPVSTDRSDSVDRLEQAERLLLGFYKDPLAVIDAALAEDPDFVMGHCFRAGLHLISSEKAAEPELAHELRELGRLKARANERERGHAAAIRAWLARDFQGASEAYGKILYDCPRDLVALQLAHQCDFFLGQSTMLRDRVAWVLPEWKEGEVGYSYLLGMQAFGLEECGHYGRAEEAGRRAVSLEPRDPWAIHAVTHVCEMQGRTDDGLRWLDETVSDWAPDNLFAFHNWWHYALYLLERGEPKRVLEVYDRNIRPEPSAVALEMVDAASLLWRLHLLGVDVGRRWDELAETYAAGEERAYYPFNDVHAMMAFVATGREREAARVVGDLEMAAGDETGSARLIRDVGLPLSRAFRAFGKGDYQEAFELLLEGRKTAHRFGGSHAQRDVLNLTLLESAIRAGNGAAGRILNERLAARPESPLCRLYAKRIREAAEGGAR